MDIVTGSGRNRKVFTFPDASVVHASPKAEQKAAKHLLCEMLNIDPESHKEVAYGEVLQTTEAV